MNVPEEFRGLFGVRAMPISLRDAFSRHALSRRNEHRPLPHRGPSIYFCARDRIGHKVQVHDLPATRRLAARR